MNSRGLSVALTCLLTPACTSVQETPPVELAIGVHEMTLKAPEGWEHLDHGLEHRFHNGLSQISLSDLGPVTREAYLREILHARKLFRDGYIEDARARLSALDLRPAFSGAQEWKEFTRSWWVALDGGRSTDISRFDVEVAWEEILKEVERLGPPDLVVIVEATLPAIDTAAHREVAEQRPITIDGLDGMRVETWDRLSHDHRESYVFVLNEGNLFVVRMEMGRYAEMKPAFETLVDSKEFHSGSSTS